MVISDLCTKYDEACKSYLAARTVDAAAEASSCMDFSRKEIEAEVKTKLLMSRSGSMCAAWSAQEVIDTTLALSYFNSWLALRGGW